jgi:hypothetical protein
MAILKEYRCTFHDYEFESMEKDPSCPYGCHPSIVVREIRTAPGYKSDSSRTFDSISKQVAQDYNLTDMRGDKSGTSVMSNTMLGSGGAKQTGNQGPHWRPDFTVQQGWLGRGEKAPSFNPPKSWTCAQTPIQSIQEGARNYLSKATRFVGTEKK